MSQLIKSKRVAVSHPTLPPLPDGATFPKLPLPPSPPKPPQPLSLSLSLDLFIQTSPHPAPMAESPNPSSGDLPAGVEGSPEKRPPADRRVAALAGAGARYKAMSPARLPISREPCLTIPAGFSPSAQLESPVLRTNFKVITDSLYLSLCHLCYSGI